MSRSDSIDLTPPEVNGRSNLDIVPSLTHAGDAPYHPCPEAFPDATVAAGTVTKHADWNQSRIYPRTLRDVFVYTPAGLDASRPAALIVFNDGYGYVGRRGPMRAAQVLDSLHASGEIEQTVGGVRQSGSAARSRRRPLAAERHCVVAAQLRIRLADARLRDVPDRGSAAVRRARTRASRSPTIPTVARSAASAAAASARSPWRGSIPITFAACSVTAVRSRTSAAATTIRI